MFPYTGWVMDSTLLEHNTKYKNKQKIVTKNVNLWKNTEKQLEFYHELIVIESPIY